MIKELVVGQLSSNGDIFSALGVGNAGGIRLSIQKKAAMRVAIMASLGDFHAASENPYHDRLESGILTYTAAGKVGEQTLAGMNHRVFEQKQFAFRSTDSFRSQADETSPSVLAGC